MKKQFLKNSAIATATAVALGAAAMSFANPLHIEAESYYASTGGGAITNWQCGNNCWAVGWLDAGEWMSYNVNLPPSDSGQYRVTYRVASAEDYGKLILERAGGGAQFGDMTIGNTGGWSNWQEISHVINIPQNESALAVLVEDGGFNIDWFQIEAVDSPSGNQIVNGEFNSSDDSWQTYVDSAAQASVHYGPDFKILHANISIFNGGFEPWHVQLRQNGLTLEQGKTYRLSFDTFGSNLAGSYEVVLEEDGNDYTAYSPIHLVNVLPFEDEPSQHVEFEFTMNEPTDSNARLTFNAGGIGDLGGFFSFFATVDNVELVEVP